mgnify:CR=1 FL=1
MANVNTKLDTLGVQILKEGTRLTVTVPPKRKVRRASHLILGDTLMLAWLSNKGYNIDKVVKSGHFNNLDLNNSDSTWIFELAKRAPKKKDPVVSPVTTTKVTPKTPTKTATKRTTRKTTKKAKTD